MSNKLISLNQLKMSVTRIVAAINKKLDKPKVDGTKDQILILNAAGETEWKDNIEIIDNLTSTDTDKALSANQGKVLKDEYLDGRKFKYLTTTEYEALSEADKAKVDMTYILTDVEDNVIDVSGFADKNELVKKLDKPTKDGTTGQVLSLNASGKPEWKDNVEIIDNLTSTDTDKALSANQGKVLKDEYLDGRKFKYLTTTEYEALSSAEKNRTDLVYVLTDVDDFILDLSGYATKENLPVDMVIDNGKLKLKDGDGNFVGTGLTPDELKTFLGL